MNYHLHLMKGAFLSLLINTSAFAQVNSGNIMEVAASIPELRTFVSVVKAAGLEETLSGPGPFTVFAPTNAAFAQLLPGALDNLLRPENKQRLLSILNTHLVGSNEQSSNLASGKMMKTVGGKELKISLQGNQVQVNDAQVIKADLTASNGVVHLIDKVIMP